MSEEWPQQEELRSKRVGTADFVLEFLAGVVGAIGLGLMFAHDPGTLNAALGLILAGVALGIMVAQAVQKYARTGAELKGGDDE